MQIIDESEQLNVNELLKSVDVYWLNMYGFKTLAEIRERAGTDGRLLQAVPHFGNLPELRKSSIVKNQQGYS